MKAVEDKLVLLGWAVLAAATAETRAGASESSGEAGGVEYRVLAPDWIWRGEKLNVLVILTARERPAAVALHLDPPLEAFELPGAGWSPVLEARLAAGETRRLAFRGLEARHVEVAARPFALAMTVDGGATAELRFSVDTVRGPLVPKGMWSIAVPALVACLTLPAFLLLLRRHAARGAWRTVREAVVPEVGAPEAWWRARS
jgi:hypothetical protein